MTVPSAIDPRLIQEHTFLDGDVQLTIRSDILDHIPLDVNLPIDELNWRAIYFSKLPIRKSLDNISNTSFRLLNFSSIIPFIFVLLIISFGAFLIYKAVAKSFKYRTSISNTNSPILAWKEDWNSRSPRLD